MYLDGDPLVGSVLAERYMVEACVGEGGMGRVYRARHIRLSRHFAIKVLYGDLAADFRMRERFAREAEAVSRLSHPNVVSVVDFGSTPQGLLYLVMEFIEGRELSEIIADEAPMPPERVMPILRQLCAGLGHAHDAGLIHRDFKGDNALVSSSSDGELIRVVDFGIAVLQDMPEMGRGLTTNGMVLGTPAYMSPEQATGDKLDHRTDLFSLGVVLYQMLAGTLPFEGSPIALAQQNVACVVPAIRDRVPGLEVDAQLEKIARRLMEKDPARRFQSASEVATVLDALGDTVPTSTRLARPDPEPPARASGPGELTMRVEVRSARAGVSVRGLLAVLCAVLGAALLVLLAFSFSSTPGPAGQDEKWAAASPSSDGWVATSAGPVEPAPRPAPAARRMATQAVVEPAAISRASGSSLPTTGESAPAAIVEPSRARLEQPRASRAPSRARRSGAEDATGGDGESDLLALYKKVGRDLDTLIKTRGAEQVASLSSRYRDIPVLDAQRDPGLGRDARRTLRSLQREIRARLRD